MDTVAAVDLGSNSFHMVIARRDAQELRIVDRLREGVQLAAGLDAKSRISEEAQERALACLERFGQRLEELEADQVRAVGTNTLRKARNARKFLMEGDKLKVTLMFRGREIVHTSLGRQQLDRVVRVVVVFALLRPEQRTSHLRPIVLERKVDMT